MVQELIEESICEEYGRGVANISQSKFKMTCHPFCPFHLQPMQIKYLTE